MHYIASNRGKPLLSPLLLEGFIYTCTLLTHIIYLWLFSLQCSCQKYSVTTQLLTTTTAVNQVDNQKASNCFSDSRVIRFHSLSSLNKLGIKSQLCFLASSECVWSSSHHACARFHFSVCFTDVVQ